MKKSILLVVLACVVSLQTMGRTGQPSISFGAATLSLGMTIDQVKTELSHSARHLTFLPDKVTGLVYAGQDDLPGSQEGQVTFSGGRVIYAQFQMPSVMSADELVDEIAGAVEGMEDKTCNISNWSAHGTGGGYSQSIFTCGSRRFNVMTVRVLGSSRQTINVNIEIGSPTAN